MSLDSKQNTRNTYVALAGLLKQTGWMGYCRCSPSWCEAGQGWSAMSLSDLFFYSSSVYTPSACAQRVACHAVTVSGVDYGVPYKVVSGLSATGPGRARSQTTARSAVN